LLLFTTMIAISQQTSSILCSNWTFDSILDDFTLTPNHLENANGGWIPVTYGLGRDSLLPNRSIRFGNAYALQVITYYAPFGVKELQIDTTDKGWSVAAWMYGYVGPVVSTLITHTFQDSIITHYDGQFSFSISNNQQSPFTAPKFIRTKLLGANDSIYVIDSDTLFVRNKWNHVVWVGDKDVDSLFVYLNSNKILSGALPELKQEKSRFSVGGDYYKDSSAVGLGSYHKVKSVGNIDELQIYKKALQASEVLELYSNNTISAIPNSLTAYNAMLYPNPAHSSLKLMSNQIIEAVSIYDLTGSLMSNYTLGKNSQEVDVDIELLVPGAYVLVSGNVNGSTRQLFLKQ
jgi:hypothetical protein